MKIREKEIKNIHIKVIGRREIVYKMETKNKKTLIAKVSKSKKIKKIHLI